MLHIFDGSGSSRVNVVSVMVLLSWRQKNIRKINVLAEQLIIEWE